MRSVHVSLLWKCVRVSDPWCSRVTPLWMYFMLLIRNVYVWFRCTHPDWGGTATEKTDIHLFFNSPIYILKVLWWVCGCRSKCVSETDNSLTSSGKLFRVSSFVFNICSVLFFSDKFSKEAVIRMRYPHSEFAVILCGQNCVLDPTFDDVSNVIHFPINPFNKAIFQGFLIDQILIGC